MRIMMMAGLVLMVVFAARAEATDSVVEENGREVGSWTENDGKEKKEQIDVDLKQVLADKPDAPAQPIREIEPLSEDALLELESRQSWGIVKGMTLSKVQEIAQQRGFSDSNVTNETRVEVNGTPQSFIVYTYRFKTENFDHVKKIYIEPNSQLVDQVMETAEKS